MHVNRHAYLYAHAADMYVYTMQYTVFHMQDAHCDVTNAHLCICLLHDLLQQSRVLGVILSTDHSLAGPCFYPQIRDHMPLFGDTVLGESWLDCPGKQLRPKL